LSDILTEMLFTFVSLLQTVGFSPGKLRKW